MCPDVLAGSGKSGPDAGMRASGEQVERQRRKRGQDCLDEGLTAGPVFGGGAVHAVQQSGSVLHPGGLRREIRRRCNLIVTYIRTNTRNHRWS
jgi:hypothetical protein